VSYIQHIQARKVVGFKTLTFDIIEDAEAATPFTANNVIITSGGGWTMDTIKALIPHRDPFLLVDKIVSADADEIIGLKTFEDSYFVFSDSLSERKLVSRVILIESMAQCGGVGAKRLRLVNEDLFALAKIETARFHDDVEPGKVVTMVIKNLKVRNKGIKQSGTAYCNGNLVAEATWWCVKLK